MITIENFQAYLLDKAEGRLRKDTEEELEKFFESNPQLIPEEDEYDSNLKIFSESEICYPKQEELFRKKSKAKSLIFWYASIAASIAIILTVHTLFFNTNINKNNIAVSRKNKINIQSKEKTLPIKIFHKKITPSSSLYNKIEKEKELVVNIQELPKAYQNTTEISLEVTDTLRIISNDLIVYGDNNENEEKIDTVYIYTNQLCSYFKTSSKNPIVILGNSIVELFAIK